MENLLQTVKPRLRKRTLPAIVGEVFSHLTIVDERRVKNGLGKSTFEVYAECVCGIKKWVSDRSVRRGLVQSCGSCANKTHGASKTPEYAVWRGILARCLRNTHPAYHNYGGRGITVCAQWYTFQQFFADMGRRPFKGASLERVDNNLGYTKTNCCWANTTTQSRNRRSNRRVTVAGETKTIAEWAEQYGIRHNTIAYRLNHGWPAHAAVSTTPNFANDVGDHMENANE